MRRKNHANIRFAAVGSFLLSVLALAADGIPTGGFCWFSVQAQTLP